MTARFFKIMKGTVALSNHTYLFDQMGRFGDLEYVVDTDPSQTEMIAIGPQSSIDKLAEALADLWPEFQVAPCMFGVVIPGLTERTTARAYLIRKEAAKRFMVSR